MNNKRNGDKNSYNVQHPLFGISIKNWIEILDKNGGVDRKFLARGVFITLSSIFFLPARVLFKIRYGKKINYTKIDCPPVIIIGHWRSGTTYLHELLAQDPQFCYVKLWHTMLPDSFLVLNPVKEFLSNFLPEKRPMDEIKVTIDGPYEEEAAIAVVNPWSFFHCFHFARNAEEQYQKSIHFTDLNDEEKSKWKNNYLKFMKAVTFENNGKRLLLKNPANTARIPVLQELFPDAKFIHIYRNPYKVYLSTIKMRHNVLNALALQEGDEKEIECQVIENYKKLMENFFEQKKLIPEENYFEIRYEDFVKDPIKHIKKIYSDLKIPGFEKALPGFKRYLESKKNYKKNVYDVDSKIIERVRKHWFFTIDMWGYKPPK